MSTPIIETRNLHKWYSGVHALKGVSLKIEKGQALGLVGDNGAGKSTLINILSGLHRQDEGEILLEGQEVDIRNPKDSMRLGIETIYQYNSMVPLMTISRNVFIGREPLKWSIGGFGILDEQKMREESVKAIADVDLHLRSPDALVGELSGGQRQRLALARAVYGMPKLIVLDEPNSSLDEQGDALFIELLKALKAAGSTVVIVTHKTSPLAVVDKILFLNDGRMQLWGPRDEVLAKLKEVVPS